MRRDRLEILVCLASEVLIFLGVFFIMSMTFPWMAPPMYTGWVLLFLLPALLILTRVMMLKKSERKPDIEALCEHLRKIGLDATVESKQQEVSFRTRIFAAFALYTLIFCIFVIGITLPFILEEMILKLVSVSIFILAFIALLFFDPRSTDPTSFIYHTLYEKSSLFLGSIRVANRNIDLIELQKWAVCRDGGEYPSGFDERYGCFFVVQAKLEGLEDKLKAETEPVIVRNELVDINWKGGELAEVLNSDATLGDMLRHVKDRDEYRDASYLEIKPDKEQECLRIRPKADYYVKTGSLLYYLHYYSNPADAFPSIETFEAFDRIAQHIRSIANVRP